MKTLAVIPARLGATRLPRKPLRLLAGRPLVVRVWERVAAMDVAERCVIATDSEEVAAAARKDGAEAVLTSADHPSGTDRVAEVAKRREFAGFDVVLNVQGDEPFISADAVRGALGMVRGEFKIGTAAVHATAAVLMEPSVVKVVTADDGRALYFSRAAIPFLRRSSLQRVPFSTLQYSTKAAACSGVPVPRLSPINGCVPTALHHAMNSSVPN